MSESATRDYASSRASRPYVERELLTFSFTNIPVLPVVVRDHVLTASVSAGDDVPFSSTTGKCITQQMSENSTHTRFAAQIAGYYSVVAHIPLPASMVIGLKKYSTNNSSSVIGTNSSNGQIIHTIEKLQIGESFSVFNTSNQVAQLDNSNAVWLEIKMVSSSS